MTDVSLLMHYDACPWVGTFQETACESCGLIAIGVALGRAQAASDIVGFAAAGGIATPAYGSSEVAEAVETRLRWFREGLTMAAGVAERGFYRG